jgi:hypothetical protein
MPLDIGNLWIRENFKTHDTQPLDVHEHEEDHVWILTHGAARLENWKPDGELDEEVTGDYDAEDKPVMINVPAKNRHKVTALKDGTYFLCVFAKYLPDGQIAKGR